MSEKRHRLIYCRFCGARLRRDSIGWKCPTQNCQWQHGAPEAEVYYTDRVRPRGKPAGEGER